MLLKLCIGKLVASLAKSVVSFKITFGEAWMVIWIFQNYVRRSSFPIEVDDVWCSWNQLMHTATSA